MKKLNSFWKIFIILCLPIIIGTILLFISQYTEKADESVIAYIGIGFYIIAFVLALVFIGKGIYNAIRKK